jgi:hypothetical protein
MVSERFERKVPMENGSEASIHGPEIFLAGMENTVTSKTNAMLSG